MTPVALGDVLAGKYRVTKVLGIGGMGVVVAATHIQLDEPVALKFMLPEALGSPEAVARFLREARAAVKLRSEHVARVSDVGTLETGAPYIVMEYLDGTDLAGLLASRGPLPPEEAVEYILQACDALAEAHSLGIVHRDLKPANLFLTRRRDATPLVKVLDFGISKSSTLNEQAAGALTKTGGIMGSPLYMSPEQMKSAKDTDARADVWALGVILYELLSGRTPFEADTLGGLMALVLTEPSQPLSSVRAGLPPALCEVVRRCLEKDRNARWSNVALLAAALAPFAPMRAQVLVERISIVLGQGSTSTLAQTGSASHGGPYPVAAITGGRSGTVPGWGDASQSGTTKSGRGIQVAIGGIALVAVVAITAFVALRHNASPSTPQGAAVSAAPGPLTPTPAEGPSLRTAVGTTALDPPPTPTPADPEPSTLSSSAPRPGGKKGLSPAANQNKKQPSVANPAASALPTPGPAPAPAPAKPQGGILDTSN